MKHGDPTLPWTRCRLPDHESTVRPRDGRRGRCLAATALRSVVALLLVGSAASAAGAQGPTATAAALRQLGERLRREQRLSDALAVYQALVERDSATFEDRFWVGKLEGWTGRIAAAESAFVQLVDERPEDYDARIALVDVRMWRGHLSAARAILEDLRRTHSADPEVLLRWGQLAEAEGDLREARRRFLRVIAIDPNHPGAREALRRMALVSRWQADVEYYGEQLPRQPATNGVTVGIQGQETRRLRWRSSGTLQEKFDRTEFRVGGDLAYRPLAPTELRWSAYLAPGAEVMPRQTFGLGVDQRLWPHLVLNADYTFLNFREAEVHQIGPGLELYVGRHWLLAGRYRYSSTRFTGAQGAVSNHGGLVALGYLYGAANLLRGFAAAGAEPTSLPSRDVIGQFHAHTIGGAWRHFVTPRLGVELLYAHQDRSDGTNLDSYGLRLVQRW